MSFVAEGFDLRLVVGSTLASSRVVLHGAVQGAFDIFFLEGLVFCIYFIAMATFTVLHIPAVHVKSIYLLLPV